MKSLAFLVIGHNFIFKTREKIVQNRTLNKTYFFYQL